MPFTKDTIVIVPIPSDDRFIDLTGDTYGLRTVLGYAGKTPSRHPYWWCECTCGSITKSSGVNLKLSASCGCQNNIRIGIQARRHGMCTTPVYKIWGGMVSRCRSAKHSQYSDYGGRGITVCDEWFKFENFYNDMGARPSNQHSLDRIDVNGNYCPENCRWATPEEQNNNRRCNIYLTHDGRTQTIAQWSRELNISTSALRQRKRRGMTDEEILTTPFHITIRHKPTSPWKGKVASEHLLALSRFLFDLAGECFPSLDSEHAVERFLQELVGGQLTTERVLDLLAERSVVEP